VDLAGVISFVRDFFQTFNCLAKGSTIERRPENTPVTATPRILPQSFPRKIYGLLQALGVVTGLMIRQKGRCAATLIRTGAASIGPTSAVMHTISSERMKRYLAAARHSAVTFNSFIAAAHVEALCRWKKQKKEACLTVRVQVHQDLRKTREEYRMFGNKFSPFVIMIHEEDNKNAHSLLRNVHQQAVKAKNCHVAEKMLNFTWIFQYSIIKKLFPFFARSLNRPANPMLGDSFTLSNCGRLWAGQDGETYLTHLGESEVTECFMPGYPVPSVGVFTSFSTFRNKLCLSFSYYKHVLSEEDAEKFIDLFEHTMDDIADIILLKL
jgi:NRPS condensation-like uncharacterized protein